MPNLLPIETRFEKVNTKEQYFLFLGSLTKNKGVFTLLKAFHKASLDGWKLKFAGTGEEQEKLEKYIIKNHLNFDNIC